MNNRIISISLTFLMLCTFLQAQEITPERLGFRAYQLEDEALGHINYYLTGIEGDSKKPLIVYLDGSGPYPLFQKVAQGIGSTVVLDWQNLSKDYRIAVISKPGVPFIDEVGSDPATGFPTYDEPEAYTETLSEAWRVASADMVIDDIFKKVAVEEERVLLLGFSEGAQVAPHVAAANDKVTHLMIFGGNGLNQLYDPIITARYKAERGQLTHEQAQAEIDSLFTVYDQIYRNPESTTDFWYGHTYKRWASFAKNPPVESLKKLDIPVYIAYGSRDENPVVSADFIKLEFVRMGKQNLTYKVYPDFDHSFNHIQFEGAEFKGATPQLSKVMEEAFSWFGEN